MTTTWTYRKQTAKRQPCAVMPGVCLTDGLNMALSETRVNFGGELGNRLEAIDSRLIRH